MYKNNKIPSSNSKNSQTFSKSLFVMCFVVVIRITLHIKVFNILVFAAPGHCVLLAEALHFLCNLVPVFIVSLDVIGVVNDNLVSLAVIGGISFWVVAWKS